MAKSWLLTILIVILIVLGAGPYVMGIMSKSSVEKAVNALSYPPFYQVKITHYHVGWLHSTVNMKVVGSDVFADRAVRQLMHSAGGKVSEKVFATAVGHIQNGPLIWTMDPKTNSIDWHVGRGMLYTQFQLNSKLRKAIVREIKMLPKIHGTTLIGLNGSYNWHFALEPINFFKKRKGLIFDWQGIRGRWTADGRLNHFDISLHFLPLNVSDKRKNIFHIGNIDIESSNDRNNAFELWLGNGDAVLNSINFKNRGKELFDLKKFSMKQTNTLDKGLLSATMELKLAKFDFMGQAYAPSSFSMKLSKLDAKAMSEIVKLAEKANASLDNVKVQQEIGLQMVPKLITAFGRGAELSSKFNITTPEGNIMGDVKAVLGKPKNPGLFAMQKAVMDSTITINLSAPKSLITKIWRMEELKNIARRSRSANDKTYKEMSEMANKRIEKNLVDATNKHLISIDGDTVKIHAVYEKQKLNLNGHNIPLNGLKRMF